MMGKEAITETIGMSLCSNQLPFFLICQRIVDSSHPTLHNFVR